MRIFFSALENILLLLLEASFFDLPKLIVFLLSG